MVKNTRVLKTMVNTTFSYGNIKKHLQIENLTFKL